MNETMRSAVLMGKELALHLRPLSSLEKHMARSTFSSLDDVERPARGWKGSERGTYCFCCVCSGGYRVKCDAHGYQRALSRIGGGEG